MSYEVALENEAAKACSFLVVLGAELGDGIPFQPQVCCGATFRFNKLGPAQRSIPSQTMSK